MGIWKRIAVAGILAAGLFSPCLADSTAKTELTTISLASNVSTIGAGEDFWLMLHLQLQPGWHTYWQNPGDSGMAPSIDWVMPPGFSAGSIHLPPPERILIDSLVNYGYHSQAYLLVPVTPSRIQGNNASFSATAHWLVCKDICIPESATVDITLPVAERSIESVQRPAIGAQLAKLPKTVETPIPYRADDGTVTFDIPMHSLGLENPTLVTLLPVDNEIISNSATPQITQENGSLTVSVKRGSLAPLPQFTLWAGFADNSQPASTKFFAFTLKRETAAAPAPFAHPQSATDTDITFAAALLLAVLGGIILNVMPCVLPVLALKTLALSKKSHGNRAMIFRQGLAYTAGVMVSGALLAAILIGLQTGGEAVGWGYQMQSPLFVLFLAYLMFLVGLNLSGAYVLPTVLGNVGSSFTQKENSAGSLATGILATLVATPCSAPFMAPAVGFALTLPPLQALAIFLALSFGLALPYLLISIIPALIAWLPKPGGWMITFRQFLAFPMYATAAWLLWVLAQQTGPNGLLAGLLGCILLAFTIWLYPRLERLSTPGRILSLLALIALCLIPFTWVSKTDVLPASQGEQAEIFSLEKLEQLRTQGVPVFVNATAAWCITCKYNERAALDSSEVKARMKEQNIAYLKADWTQRDAHITQYLASFGRRGVPLYVYYPPYREPILLPQLLTKKKVLQTLQNP